MVWNCLYNGTNKHNTHTKVYSLNRGAAIATQRTIWQWPVFGMDQFNAMAKAMAKAKPYQIQMSNRPSEFMTKVKVNRA